MKIHHLNCLTMCPVGEKFLTGEGSLFSKARLVAHCLLIESEEGLILVDTGIGTGDVLTPEQMGQPFRALVNPQPKAEETAIHQIRELGLDPDDVTHIACTHLDIDHAGGLPDFPNAEVHVFRPERDAVLNPTWREKTRYIDEHFAHGPKWNAHDVDGDDWFGFESCRVLGGDAEVLLIPVTGHSRGNCAVAVRTDTADRERYGAEWLLHCGDAYFYRGEMEQPPRCPHGAAFFQNAVQLDGTKRKANQERLRELAGRQDDEVRLFCSHDPVEFEQLA